MHISTFRLARKQTQLCSAIKKVKRAFPTTCPKLKYRELSLQKVKATNQVSNGTLRGMIKQHEHNFSVQPLETTYFERLM